MKTLNIIPAFLVAALSLTSCSDDWDNHYDRSETAATESVLDMVKGNPDLSTFARMIEIAGYSDLLGSSQTFTVFAPTNEALAGVNLENTDEVKRIVANHIARFNNSTASDAAQGVKMYNGKRFFFDGNNFGGATLDDTDNIATNGILHIVSTQIPYVYNLREYFDTHDNTSAIAEFIARFDEKQLDLEASVAIGVDEKGQTVYDSVLVDYNPLFDRYRGIGDIADEDSVFTMIIPDNVAWQKAYDRISPYFNVYNADQAVADSIRDVQTSLAIISDLVYRQEVEDPAAFPKLMSTTGSEIFDVPALFAGTTRIKASNGWIYTAPRVNYDNTETWNKEIEVEGETQTGRTPGAGTTINVRSVDSDNPFADVISEMRYIEVSSTSPSRQPGVTISIPDVLSGQYDIYASFVPANVLDATAVNDSTRVSFTISYMGANGRNTTSRFTNSDFITRPTEMTLIKVAEGFSFPVSNYYDRLWWMDETHSSLDQTVTTTVYVTTNVSNTEFNRGVMTRRFRLDRIIFVPVKNLAD